MITDRLSHRRRGRAAKTSYFVDEARAADFAKLAAEHFSLRKTAPRRTKRYLEQTRNSRARESASRLEEKLAALLVGSGEHPLLPGQPETPGSIGFHGVPETVWTFHIGGYQVCEKWLKDRMGGTLSKGNLTHDLKIVTSLTEPIYLMRGIDEIIETCGGWPGASSWVDTASVPSPSAISPLSTDRKKERTQKLPSEGDLQPQRRKVDWPSRMTKDHLSPPNRM